MPMVQGPIAWAKIGGKPQPGYDKRLLEWSFDLGITKDTLKTFQELGVQEYIKPKVNPKNGKAHVLELDYTKFSRKEIKADGSPAKPIRVVDRAGKDWPEDRLIGNGSIVNVKFMVNEKQTGGFKPNVVAVQVWEYKPYENEDSFPVSEDGAEEW